MSFAPSESCADSETIPNGAVGSVVAGDADQTWQAMVFS
jgi:hypothetical protein